MTRFRRPTVALLVALGTLVAVCAAASAAWTGSGTGVAGAQAGALAAPTIDSVSTASHQSLTIAWSAPAGGPAPTGYVVHRETDGGTAVACTATGALTCTESGLVPETTYRYTVTAVLHDWVGPASAVAEGTTGATSDPVVDITFPSGAVDADAWASGCSPNGICGTATAGTADLEMVQVAIEGAGGWWNGTGFVSSTEPVWNLADGTTSWRLGFAMPPAGSYTVVARATDLDDGTATDTETFTVGVANTPPQLVTLEMFDRDADGKVDEVVATFDEPLAPSTATGPWTLANVPSGGTLASVLASGSIATLTLTEGTGPVDTGVGTFTVALAADSSAGIRDSAGMAASFTARAPADKAKPMVVSLADQPAGSGVRGTIAGRAQAGDTLDVTFSEPIQAPSTPQVVRIDQGNSGNSSLTVPGVVTVTDMGARYIQDNGANRFINFNTSTLSLINSGRTVRVALGAPPSGSHTPASVSGTATVTLAASGTVTDSASNSALTTPRNLTGIRFF